MIKLIEDSPNKLTRNKFKQIVLDKGSITIDKDGRYKFVLAKLNDNDIAMTSKFKEQLENEGLYDNSWVGFITNSRENAPYRMDWLPIFGSSDKYITKWLTHSPESAIDAMLSDRQIALLKRANEYYSLTEKRIIKESYKNRS